MISVLPVRVLCMVYVLPVYSAMYDLCSTSVDSYVRSVFNQCRQLCIICVLPVYSTVHDLYSTSVEHYE